MIPGSDAELRIMTGYGREEFGTLYRAFAGRWEIMEREGIERREQYARQRAGKRGPRPAADAYEGHIRNMPPMRDDPQGRRTRATGTGSTPRTYCCLTWYASTATTAGTGRA